MRRNSLAFRLVAGAAVWCALWLSAGGYALSALFGKTVERNFDARLGVLIEGLVAGSELNPDGQLELRPQIGEPRFEQPLSGWYWQIADGAQVLRRSFSLWDAALPAALAPGELAAARYVTGPDGQPLRLLVRAITLPGADARLLYAVAGDRREIQLDRLNFNRLLSLALGVLFIGVLGAVLVQVRFGLEPLRRMGRALGAIRGGATRAPRGRLPRRDPAARDRAQRAARSQRGAGRARAHPRRQSRPRPEDAAQRADQRGARQRRPARRAGAPAGRADAPPGRSPSGARPGDRHRLDPRRAHRRPAGAARSRAHARPHLCREGARDRGRRVRPSWRFAARARTWRRCSAT